MTYDMLVNVRVIKCKVTSVGTGHFTQFSILLLFPKLSSCCREAEDNLPTEGMSTPPADLIVEMWKSIERYIQNLYMGHVS